MGVTLFLSPHLDDAALSCGGIIHRLTRGGERVIIITAMAGEPPDALPDSPVIAAVKARYGGATPVQDRRIEDAQAAQALGAQVYHLPLTECAFRTTVCGAGDVIALYPDHDSPFAGVRDGDDAPLILVRDPACRSPTSARSTRR